MPPVMSRPVERSGDSRHEDIDNLRVALADGDMVLAKSIIMKNPGLATERINQDGDATVMDVICEQDGAIVKALLEDLRCDLHCLKDYKQRTILHVAAGKDDVEVVRVLVTLCPKCIQELNSQAETPLHVAVKNGRLGCFLALMEKIQQPEYIHWRELLNHRDSEGNTLLHVAVSRKLVQIVRELLSYKKRYGVLVVDVNLRNISGLTARDLHQQKMSDSIDRDIADILHTAGAKRGHELGRGEEIMEKTLQENVDFMRKSLLLALFIFAAGGAYQILFNLRNVYPQQQHVKVFTTTIKDAIRSPSLLPEIFYVLGANTVVFVGSMSVILVISWSMGRKCSLYYRALPLLVTGAMLVSYGLVMKVIVPNFSITVGPYEIPSFLAVWLLDLPLVSLSVAAWLLGKQNRF